jgi:hypothetical protein
VEDAEAVPGRAVGVALLAAAGEGEQDPDLVQCTGGFAGVGVEGGSGAGQVLAQSPAQAGGVDRVTGNQRVGDAFDPFGQGAGMGGEDRGIDLGALTFRRAVDGEGDEARVQIATERPGAGGDRARIEPAPGEQVADQARGGLVTGLVACLEDGDPGERRPRGALQVLCRPLAELAGGHDRPGDLAFDDDRHHLDDPRRPGRQPARDQFGDEAFARRAGDALRARPRDQDLDPCAGQLGRDRRHAGEAFSGKQRPDHAVEGGLRERSPGRCGRGRGHRRSDDAAPPSIRVWTLGRDKRSFE